jgi:3-deoxy-D-manno-octulosonic-acid transferase
MRFIVDLAWLLIALVTSPWWLYRLCRTGEWRHFIARFQSRHATAGPGCVWLHGSSVGEVTLLRPLVALLEREMPQVPLTISAFTPTGVAAARKAWPHHHVIVLPFDFSFTVRRALNRIAPRLIVIAESDFWPNLLLAAASRAVPVVVVNARVSERSARRLALTRIVPGALRRTALLLVQNAEFRDRFVHLDVPAQRVVVTGNMKYDQTVPVRDVMRGELRAGLGYCDDDLVVIGGSLHQGEDEIVLQAFREVQARQPNLCLIIVPRYPAEADQLATTVRSRELPVVLSSELDAGLTAPPGRSGVLIVDTLGELARMYALADIAFVGGSLYFRGRNKGGHNVMEPAVAGIPVLFGPWNYSFRDTVADLVSAGGGMEVADADALAVALATLAEDGNRRRAMGAAAKQTVLRGQGATRRNFELISQLLSGAGDRLPLKGFDSTMPRAAPGTD